MYDLQTLIQQMQTIIDGYKSLNDGMGRTADTLLVGELNQEEIQQFRNHGMELVGKADRLKGELLGLYGTLTRLSDAVWANCPVDARGNKP